MLQQSGTEVSQYVNALYIIGVTDIITGVLLIVVLVITPILALYAWSFLNKKYK